MWSTPESHKLLFTIIIIFVVIPALILVFLTGILIYSTFKKYPSGDTVRNIGLSISWGVVLTMWYFAIRVFIH